MSDPNAPAILTPGGPTTAPQSVAGLKKDLASIQALRAIAALMVVFHHCREQFEYLKDLLPTEIGGAGVEIFFVISGFIMVYITHQRETSPLDFGLKRVMRVVPLYWLFTTLLAIIAVISPSALESAYFSISHYVLSLGFVPHENAAGRIRPLLSLGWTLDFEMFFYLVFALALAVSYRWRVVLSTVMLGAFVLIGVLLQPTAPALQVYTKPIILCFASGMGLAVLVLRGVRLPKPVALLMIAAGVLLFAAATPHVPEGPFGRAAWIGAASFLLVAGCLFLELGGRFSAGSLMRRLGDASYALYLSHLFVLGAMRLVWRRLDLPMDSPVTAWTFVIVGMIACSAGGLLTHYCVEKPITSVLSRWLKRLPLRPAEARRPA